LIGWPAPRTAADSPSDPGDRDHGQALSLDRLGEHGLGARVATDTLDELLDELPGLAALGEPACLSFGTGLVAILCGRRCFCVPG
jgi:hypothetical protein